MGLFSRRRKAQDPQEDPNSESAVEELAPEEPEEEAEATVGPFDEADHPERGDLLDAGSLWIPAVKGATIQFSVDRRRDVVLGVVYVKAQTAVQLQVFAAPKSADIWDDVRSEMISSIASQGGSSREAQGEYGTEIRAQMPANGKRSANPVRYLGIDGPRWLLRVTVTGRGAVDDKAASSLIHEVLDHTVVSRGQTPHPPREILPLHVPRTKKADGDTADDERPRLSLPQRGPEITEIR